MDNETEKCVVYKRSHHSMSEQLQKMRKRDELCDVTIEVGEQSFRAHKVILSAAIDYFRQMFLRNSNENNEKIIWVVPDIKSENMETFIDFAYSGEIKLTEKNVQSLLIDANHLELTDVKNECVRFIESILNPKNAFSMYQIGKTHECPTLIEKSRKIVTSNLPEATKSQEFLDISSEFLGDILTSETVIQGSSEVAFDGAMKWVTHKIEERKHYLSILLDSINLSDLNADYLIEYIYKVETIVVTPNDHKDLLHIVMSQYHQNKSRNVVNDGINNNHQSYLIAIQKEDNKLCLETYDFQKDTWLPNWDFECDENIFVSCIHDDAVYFSNGNEVYAIDLKQRHVQRLSWIKNLCRALIFFEGFLYAFGPSMYCVVGSRYSFKSKQWETVPPVSMEDYYFRFVACQVYMYAIECSKSNRVVRYCPQTDKWEEIYGGREDARSYFAAAALKGKIYVCGGKIDYVVSNAVESFDPETKRWQRLASMNQARWNHGVIAWNEKLWVIGGHADEQMAGLSSVEVYDPILNTWSVVSPMKKIKGEVFSGVLSNLPSNQ